MAFVMSMAVCPMMAVAFQESHGAMVTFSPWCLSLQAGEVAMGPYGHSCQFSFHLGITTWALEENVQEGWEENRVCPSQSEARAPSE